MKSSNKKLQCLDIDSKVVASLIIKRASQSKEVKFRQVTHKKLQKLLYYVQVWHIVFFGKSVFKDDIEAWVHGPVVPRVYKALRSHGFNPVDQLHTENQLRTYKIPDSVTTIIDAVWRAYGRFDAEYLVTLTHSELPWQEARAGLDSADPSKAVIDLIRARQYYHEKYENKS